MGSCAEAELIPKAMSMLSFQLLLTPSSNPDSSTVCAVDTQTRARAELRRERSGESRCGSKFPSHSLWGLFMRGACDSPACQQILWLWLSPSTIWMLSAGAAALLTVGLWMQSTRHTEPRTVSPDTRVHLYTPKITLCASTGAHPPASSPQTQFQEHGGISLAWNFFFFKRQAFK